MNVQSKFSMDQDESHDPQSATHEKSSTFKSPPRRTIQPTPLASVYAIAERAYYRDLSERQARAMALLTAEGLTVRPGTIGGKTCQRVIVAANREARAA
jgi:hypothetical protein